MGSTRTVKKWMSEWKQMGRLQKGRPRIRGLNDEGEEMKVTNVRNLKEMALYGLS
jgi:hypothetical protein